jgi:hypothetical protein
MKKRKGKKKGIVLAIIICFSVFLTLASASLYEDLGMLRTSGCNITDYGKVSFSTSALVDKFNLYSGYSSCTFVLDYTPLELETSGLIGYSQHYGEIRQREVGTNYIVLFGENEYALEEIVGLVANYENHEILLRGEYVTFYNDHYFRLYEQGAEFEYPPYGNCSDVEGANMYTGNNGSVYVNGSIKYFNSTCVDNAGLQFPYCNNDEVKFETYTCKCSEDKCVATLSEIFILLAQLKVHAITQEFAIDAIDSWLDNPDISYVAPVRGLPPPPLPATTSGGPGAAAATEGWEETNTVSEEQFNRGHTRQLARAERVVVEVEGESHYVGVIGVTETTVTIEVGSEPQQVTLSIDEIKKFEVTNDSYYDIYVQLNSIENGKANLTVKNIHEEIPAEKIREPEEGSKLWILVIVILAAVAVIGYLFYRRKR